ncbi:MAG: hypothetical protein JNM55_09735 [Anaerolineales bacterium]|jgi:acyl-CoA reductase-like NAD-dependent aldehyde dehydrogenase|nr:hypothetical protein [Anaerolineales bacterium]
MAYQSINPYNGKTLKTFEEFTDQQLDTAIQTASKDALAPGDKVLSELSKSILKENGAA